MSLAPCPDCGNECSLLATVCPKCGRPFKPGDLKASDPEPPPKKTPEERAPEWAPEWKNGKSPTPLNNSGAIGGLIAAVLIIVVLILCCSGGRRDSVADCERERLRENQRRYEQAQRDPNYNPEYVPPCK